MKKKTYKVKHPTIKEITIGDQFVTEGGNIIEFVSYHINSHPYIFEFRRINNTSLFLSEPLYTKSLRYIDYGQRNYNDIKERYIPLKDKVNQL
jgi:hypothetical protein